MLLTTVVHKPNRRTIPKTGFYRFRVAFFVEDPDTFREFFFGEAKKKRMNHMRFVKISTIVILNECYNLINFVENFSPSFLPRIK